MKLSTAVPGLAAALLAALLPGIALAGDAPAKPVCIPAYNIDHTQIPDDNTILFYMKDHKIWKNTLVDRCVGLKINTRGFEYSPTLPASDEICDNLQSIRVRDTGQVCLLGAFTPVAATPPAH